MEYLVVLLLGLALIALGVFSFARTKKADALRAELMNRVSPEKAHPGVILYAKISRFIGIAGAFGMGIFCVVVGAISLVR
jgi:hypothetical protein